MLSKQSSSRKSNKFQNEHYSLAEQRSKLLNTITLSEGFEAYEQQHFSTKEMLMKEEIEELEEQLEEESKSLVSNNDEFDMNISSYK